MSSGFKTAAGFAAAVVVWAATANQAAAPGSAPGTAVAVVNLVKVFNDFDQTKAVNQRMGEHRNFLGQESDKKQAKIKSQRDIRDAINADSKEWYTKDEELRKLQFEFGVWESLEKDRVLEAHKRWIKRTYKGITDEIAQVAKSKGYQIVLTEEDLDDQTDDTKALLRQILQREVVYAERSVDITEEVLKNLNEAFKKAGGVSAVDFLK